MTLLAADLVAHVETHFCRSIDAAGHFFETHAAGIAAACRRMAARFDEGGSLIVFGEGAQASDAQHVAVEFVHPVLVGKRALPAIALTSDAAALTAAARAEDLFARSLSALGTPHDIALGLAAGPPSPAVLAALEAARRRGMLTMLLAGAAPDAAAADLLFTVGDHDPRLVQEVHETLYHVLWELVHVFLDEGPALNSYLSRPGATIEERVTQARDSTLQKGRDICDLRAATRFRHGAGIAAAAHAMATRFARGGRLLAFGNGGSATDAQDAAADCLAPPVRDWQEIPALALPNDVGVMTAIANDVGFEHTYARQVIAFGRPGDVALAFSTSGASRSVLAALREARTRGLLAVALAGYDGGAMADPALADYCFVASSDYVPRIQEAHATIWHALLGAAQAALRDAPEAQT